MKDEQDSASEGEASTQSAWGSTETTTRLEEFVRAVQPMSADSEADYWYRGQKRESWGLEPSLLRMTAHQKLGHETVVELEDEALNEFQSKAHLFIDAGQLDKVKTIPCWWALMQHHGAPTRLLDWTVSPYVAAYFAAQQDGSGEDGAVWCFCQQGRFTMCLDVKKDHDCIAEKVPETHLKKIVIPHGDKPGFLAELRRMNITAASLFPGVDGLGKSVAELTSLGAEFRNACGLPRKPDS